MYRKICVKSKYIRSPPIKSSNDIKKYHTHTRIRNMETIDKTNMAEITSDQAEFGEDGGNFCFPGDEVFLDFLLLFPRNKSGFNKSNRL